MTPSTEPNDKPITPKPKIVQFQPMLNKIVVLLDNGLLFHKTYDPEKQTWSNWTDITGEIPE